LTWHWWDTSISTLDYIYIIFNYFFLVIAPLGCKTYGSLLGSNLFQCYLGTLKKLFVSSHIFQRLKSLREVICKKNEDILARSEFSIIFQRGNVKAWINPSWSMGKPLIKCRLSASQVHCHYDRRLMRLW